MDEIWKSGVSPDDITSITFTTQGETLIPVDKDGKALCKAIVWLDTRAEAEAEVIREKIPAGEMYRRTGLGGIDGALPAAKVLWLYNNQPDLYERTHKFLLLEDYLIFRLTGRYVSEKSLQSSTGWYDIIKDTFKEAYGHSLLASLPELFWERKEEMVSQIRYQYHDHICERYFMETYRLYMAMYLVCAKMRR